MKEENNKSQEKSFLDFKEEVLIQIDISKQIFYYQKYNN